MLGGAQVCVRTVAWFHGTLCDQANANASRLFFNSLGFSPSRSSPTRLSLAATKGCCSPPESVLISCKSSRGSFGGRSSNRADDDRDHEFLQASLLIPETMLHYRMRRQGFQENMKWQGSIQLNPFSVGARESKGGDVTSVGQEFLRGFQSPTIFLKISCGGDFLLPIIVGEFAIERLLFALWGFDEGDCPDQFQLVQNVVEKLGFEVKMVRITHRMNNTYFAKLFLTKPGRKDNIIVDVRPSDAINVAYRCKAPIYVNKEIVSRDAVRIGDEMGRVQKAKPTYDVNLDSAAEGPDLVTEELDLVRNMDLAVKEERYNDAAKYRDKLSKLRKTRKDP